MTLLIVCQDSPEALPPARLLADRLQAAGLQVVATVPCNQMVREVVRLAPEVVIVCSPDGLGPVAMALALLADVAPRPVVVNSALSPHDELAALCAVNVLAWLPGQPDASTVAAAAALAVVQFDRQHAAQRQLAAAQARLDERKWIDRAKGVLMQHQQLSEGDAFALLRTASMQANLRVGEVSRHLIEAAQAADAVNRAGQMRMLSQRYVKAMALRAAAHGRTDNTLGEVARRMEENLARLALLPAGAHAAPLAATRQACDALLAPGAHAAGAAPDTFRPVQLAEADARAEVLLGCADALTEALEAANGVRYLHVVNLCGRQRMLSQRLAKQALLAGLLPGPQAASQVGAALQTVREFEAALVALEQAPLGTEEIRAGLATARGQWQRLMQALRQAEGPDRLVTQAALGRESEALLHSFNQLTSQFEHSMQLLLG